MTPDVLNPKCGADTDAEHFPPMDAIGTLQWMRDNIGLPNGLEEHIDEVLKQHREKIYAAIKQSSKQGEER